MILTWTLPATQDRATLDALNLASGEIYTRVLVRHWRYYKKHGVWLTQSQAEKVDDALSGSGSILHSHSIDAAQQGFYKAIQTARKLREVKGSARFPWRRKRFRTTVFKSSQIKRVEDNQVRLALANRRYLYVTIPKPLQGNPDSKLKEARLVYNRQACRYDWNLVIEDGLEPPQITTEVVMGIDLGEIHPAVCSTQTEGFVVSCRELRSTIQHRNKCLAELSRLMSKCTKGSRRWHTLRRARVKRREYFANKIRDLEHKVSRLVVHEAVRLEVSTIGLGDVRNIGDGKKLAKKSQQKISQWTHGNVRKYIEYKATRVGIRTTLVNEAYTTQTCPQCGERHKPTGRVYSCCSCGFEGHRDLVGASNILARLETGEVGGIYPEKVSYRHAHNCKKKNKVSGESASSGPCERVHVAWEQLSFL